jgi:F-box and WD-40 domain protein CDC4
MSPCPQGPFPGNLFRCFRWRSDCIGLFGYDGSCLGRADRVSLYPSCLCNFLEARTAFSRDCLALLQGHTGLVCQVQLSPTILATGGSDGRVITFDLSKYTVLHRTAAHDSSVTSLQFDENFLVTGGNDGRTRLYDTETGNFIRDLTDASETVWKVAYLKDTCAIMCKRAGRTIVEIWNMRPKNL